MSDLTPQAQLLVSVLGDPRHWRPYYTPLHEGVVKELGRESVVRVSDRGAVWVRYGLSWKRVRLKRYERRAISKLSRPLRRSLEKQAKKDRKNGIKNALFKAFKQEPDQ